MSDIRTVPIDEWGRDHWSMFAYVETCCVDRKGVIDRERVRCNPHRHPGLALDQHRCQKPYPYGSRLALAVVEPGHDDWDVFYDLEAAGLIRDIGTGMFPVALLTDLGKRVAAELRQYKAAGNNFARFRPTIG